MQNGKSTKLSPSSPTTSSKTEAASRPTTPRDILSRAYDLRIFEPEFDTRLHGLKTISDVIFTTEAYHGFVTHRALFSLAAAAKGRPAIPCERFGIIRDAPPAVWSLVDPEGNRWPVRSDEMRVYMVSQDRYEDVKKIFENLKDALPVYMDRLLDEALKWDGSTSGGAAPDFTIQLEAEHGETEESLVVERKKRATIATVRGQAKTSALPTGQQTVASPARTVSCGKHMASLSGQAIVPTSPSKIASPASSRRSSMPTPALDRRKSVQPPIQLTAKAIVRTSEEEVPKRTDSSFTRSRQPCDASWTEFGETTSGYAEVKVHRFLLPSAVPYYTYLKRLTNAFQDSTSDKSYLPHPTITFFALQVIQRWIYNPLRIGEVIEESSPNAHHYFSTSCKRLDKTSHPPPTVIVHRLIEVARAADYLGIKELWNWVPKMLLKICHGLKCTGNHCKVMVPYVLEAIEESGCLGTPPSLKSDIMLFIAQNPDTMWKRPLILLSDSLLKEILSAFTLSQNWFTTSQQYITSRRRRGSFRAGEMPVIQWWDMFMKLNRTRSAIQSSATTVRQRWDEKLLLPAIEYCVHRIAREFNNTEFAVELQSKMTSSFERSVVEDLLQKVTITAPYMSDPPFEKAVLTRKTVQPIFEGMVNLRTWDGHEGQWGQAEKRVLDYLKKEWMTMVMGGATTNESQFKTWRPAILQVLSRKLRIQVDELLGCASRRPMMMTSRTGVQKDSLGNDVVSTNGDARYLERSLEQRRREEQARTMPLRGDAPEFVPDVSS